MNHTASNCQVVFTGQLRPGIDPEQVARDFAATFHIPLEQATQLIHAGQEKVLKRDVEAANAERYRTILFDIGMEARIDVAAADNSGERCPKCGAWRVERGICQQCGILVEQFVAMRAHANRAAPQLTPAPQSPPAPPVSLLKKPPPAVSTAMQIQTLTIQHGWLWFITAWRQFVQSPWRWIGACSVMMGLSFVFGLIPLLGSVLNWLFAPVFLGGLIAGAQAQQHGGEFHVGHVLYGFTRQFSPLIIVGLLYLSGGLLIGISAAVFALLGQWVPTEAINSQQPLLIMQHVWPLIAVAIAALMALQMAYWFAPALVILDGYSPWAAMKTSFVACGRNWLPYLLFFIIMLAVGIGVLMLFGVIAGVLFATLQSTGMITAQGDATPVLFVVLMLIPMWLGMMALLAVTVIAIHAAYRTIFIHTPAPH